MCSAFVLSSSYQMSDAQVVLPESLFDAIFAIHADLDTHSLVCYLSNNCLS